MEKFDLVGQKYSFSFCPSNSIGHGGNGAVYTVEDLKDNAGNPYPEPCVVKIFDVDLNNKNYKKRKERFNLEIDFLNSVGKQIDGIVDILDFNKGGPKSPWFLMPMMSQYKYRDLQKNRIIRDLIYICNILKNIHEFDLDTKYAHRDIKPANILYFKNKPVICDFGLIWEEDREQLTWTDELIGPATVLPPELLSREHGSVVDYRKSDVYLFAKLCWTYLTAVPIGFPGPYLRNGKYFLNKDKFLGVCLEPLHELLENCTFEEWDKRESLDFCLKKLNDQLAIFENRLDNKEMIKYINNETVLNICCIEEPKAIIFEPDDERFRKVLNHFSEGTTIKIKTVNGDFYFAFGYYQALSLDSVIFFEDPKINNSQFARIFVSIKNISCDKSKITLTINCKKFDDSLKRKYQNNSVNKNYYIVDETDKIFIS